MAFWIFAAFRFGRLRFVSDFMLRVADLDIWVSNFAPNGLGSVDLAEDGAWRGTENKHDQLR